MTVTRTRPKPAVRTTTGDLSALAGPFLVSLLAGDENAVEAVFRQARAAGADLARVARDLVEPALDQVGRMWQRGEIGIAEEHLATALVARSVQLSGGDAPPTPLGAPRLVLVCLAGEFHDLGARIVAEIGRQEGWQVEFLGANLPREAAIQFLSLRRPEAVGLSVSLAAHVTGCASMVDEIRRVAPGSRVLAGGLAFRLDPALAPLAGADACVTDAVELRDWLRANRPAPRRVPPPPKLRRRSGSRAATAPRRARR
ncbi:MAG: cobalamin B12-binding domain-containing protein [Acidobacteriota bacterium]|nr:cobalamin B12-binding domain-containing protein [Acidobacteriota bacterium]